MWVHCLWNRVPHQLTSCQAAVCNLCRTGVKEIGANHPLYLRRRGIRNISAHLVTFLNYLLVFVVAFTWSGLSRHQKWNWPVWSCFIDDVSRVVSTLRPPDSASLHLLALQLKPSLFSLRAPERPLFTFSFWFKSRWRDGKARDRSLIDKGDYTTIC